jgi:phenylalanyl-tRNA synthetase beta chain
MKFSYNWIREFVPGLDVPAQALERLITMKTAECEGVHVAGVLLNGAVAARVEAVEPIPGGHNVKATVDAGRYGRKTVVCGAPNCRPGVMTVYVPLGVKQISGVLSDGMLASAAELEISKDHAGIVEITSPDQIPLADSIIEIDNKSITHRPDLWGHYGMAREVAAITGLSLAETIHPELVPAGGGLFNIDIPDLALCPRYSALVFENVTIQPSPLWLQARLAAIGLNTRNNIVDLTNLIMAEMAQPLHAFDRAKLAGDTISARPAGEGEHIKALNDEEYDLSPANLVIADASGPIAIAGVIGGALSAISDSTTSIVLESANFQASSIRKTSSALKLRTDASIRYEKAQDPLTTYRGLARAVELLPLLSPGIRLVGGLCTAGSEPTTPLPIELDLDMLDRKLGRVIEPAEVRRILESLAFTVAQTGARVFSVGVPTWRATKDISMADDLVEEVGRMIGYDSITPQPPLVPCAPMPDPPEREFLRRVRRSVSAQGYTEVSNYSFISEEEARRFGFDPAQHLRVLNPIAAGQELMRSSLLPGIHRNIVENAKHFDQFRIFEIGREIHPRQSRQPDERVHLMLAIFGTDDGRAGLQELKRVAEAVTPKLAVTPANPRDWEHPKRCADIVWNGRTAGRLSELHPNLLESGRAAVLDLDLTMVQSNPMPAIRYQPVHRFPSSAFDVSVITPERELASTLELRIRELAGELTEAVEYVREYQGAPLNAGEKSVSFRVIIGAADRTLSSTEITAVRDRIVEGLKAGGYHLRG